MSSKIGLRNTSSGRKMPALVICYKCKKHVDIKTTALCSICNHRYEPDCIGYPEKTYRMMDQESKKNWKCTTCIKNKKLVNSDSSNITLRNKKKLTNKTSPTVQEDNEVKKHKSIDESQTQDSHILTDYNTSSESYCTPTKMLKSLDGTLSGPISDLVSLSEMKDTMSQLTAKLECTQNELDNKILENNDLQRQVNKLTAEVIVLKSLCQTSSITEDTSRCSIKKRPSSAHCITSTPSSPLNYSNVDCFYDDRTLSLKKNISDLQQQLEDAKLEISRLTKQIETLTQYLHNKSEVSSLTMIPPRNSTTPTYTTRERKREHEPGRNLYIYGTQQCVGLASALMQSRCNTKYEKYRVFAETKPNAKCYDVTQNCIRRILNPDDKIVICVGENDHNLKQVLSQLEVVLETFYNNRIIVLNVNSSHFLNTSKLNNGIKNLCKKFKKCHFLNKHYFKLSEICNSINYVIDCNDYDEAYLYPANIRKFVMRNHTNSNTNTNSNTTTSKKCLAEPKKGTIPFYFNNQSCEKNKQTASPTESVSNVNKGTIPYYFPMLKKKNSFFRA